MLGRFHEISIEAGDIGDSVGFYEALGGRYLLTKPMAVRGLTSDHAVYGWQDTQELLDLGRQA